MFTHTSTVYSARYKEDPRLPRHPSETYKSEWIGYEDFLNSSLYKHYRTIEECKESVRRLGIKTGREYFERHHEDPRLPGKPHVIFKDGWVSYPHFLCDKQFYETLEEAQEAVRELDIKTPKEYTWRYKEDPKLHCEPQTMYKDIWLGWKKFFGTNVPYPSLEEMKVASKALGIRTCKEYSQRCKEDPKLRHKLCDTFPDEWKGWEDFFGEEVYATLEEAKEVIQKFHFETEGKYRKNYWKIDSCLPEYPPHAYKSSWISWSNFLGLENSNA